MNAGKRVFVGMSGGVDSSVAALLLKNQGYDVVGVFMRCFNVDGCAERDAEDARRVAEKLDIPFYVWDFEAEYKRKVVEYMISGYKAGETPNPDVMCNREIKFGIFYKKAMETGADFVATGHYVRRIEKDGKYALAIAADANKDQSYFLWTLGEDVVAHSLFPIGDYIKSDVRKIAREAELPTADKKDSQGICFLGQVSIEEFLKSYIPAKEGAIVNASGERVGEHHGAEFYTIGQRHLGVTGIKYPEGGVKDKSKTKAHYVAGKDMSINTVMVVEGGDNPALYRKNLELRDTRFTDSSRFTAGNYSVLARVRYRQPVSPAKLIGDGYFWRLEFEIPQKFVAPGQSAVFYTAEGEMLGGGVIASKRD